MQRKPHILFLANHYRGPGRSGGARTWHQVRELVRRFQVSLIIPQVDPLTQEVLSIDDLPTFPGMTLALAPCRPGSRKSLLGRLIYQTSSAMGSLGKAMRSGSPDVVLAMGAPPASALVGVLISRLKRIPILLDVRDVPLETAEELSIVRPAWVLRIARWVEAEVFRQADRIICVSDEMAEFVRARGVVPARVSTNYIGYDNFDVAPTDSVDQRRQLLEGLDEATRFIVFYAGTLATLVDIPTVLRAAERVKSDRRIGFVIVGDGERRPLYRHWAVSSRINAYFPGRIPKARVHAWCASADACVYPLRGGPAAGAMLGNKVFDYLGAGKPIIYTGPDGAVARLLLRLGAGFVLSEGDAGELARVLYQLAKNPGRFASMGLAGRKVVLESMTAAHSAHDLAQHLSELIERTRHSSGSIQSTQ